MLKELVCDLTAIMQVFCLSDSVSLVGFLAVAFLCVQLKRRVLIHQQDRI